MGGFGIQGRSPGNYQWDVDSAGYGLIRPCIVSSDNAVGYFKQASPYGEVFKATAEGYQLSSIEDLMFSDLTEGSAIDTNKWTWLTSTFSVQAANGYYNINPGAVLNNNAYAILQTIQQLPITHCQPIHGHFNLNSTLMNLPANVVIEVGWGTVYCNNPIIQDGVAWRVKNAAMYSVAANNGTEDEVQVCPSPYPLPDPNHTYECVMDIYADKYRFFIDGTLFSSKGMPTTWPSLTANPRQPWFMRVYTTATSPSATPTLRFGSGTVSTRNSNLGRSYGEIMAGMGHGGYQSPLSPFAGTHYVINNTEPTVVTSALMSNTVPIAVHSGYMGGDFAFTAIGSNANDYQLFAWLNSSAKQYVLCGYSITAISLGLIPAVALAFRWGIGVNANSSSLATADAPPVSWAPRRTAAGFSTFVISSALYTQAPPIIVSDLGSPRVVEPGRYLHFFERQIAGALTAGQIIRGNFTPIGYFR